ncbi:MAG: acyl-CoA dehydrogenase family protein [Rubripirellula sp.]
MKTRQAQIDSPNSAAMDVLCDSLRQLAPRWKTSDDWPGESLALCGLAGVYRWFLPQSSGGLGWSADDQTLGYLRLAEADFTTTFVITQYMGAIRRIMTSDNRAMIDRWIERLASAEQFSTVGVSHLTTSRRHLNQPALVATETESGFRLDGMSPWVTGAPHADVLVVGATLADGREILAAVPASTPGIVAGKGISLIALSASCTDQVKFDNVMIDRTWVLAGPIENVMSVGSGGSTGGLQTTTLAVGVSRAATNFLTDEATRRPELRQVSTELTRELDQLQTALIHAGRGDDASPTCDPSVIRGDANRLVMRTTQAALVAAKGAGFTEGHLAGRLCQQALFFLVWSCPPPVSQSHLCELAGIEQLRP